jgi:hypothetical protein
MSRPQPKHNREDAKTDAKEYVILSFFFAFSFASSRLRGRFASETLQRKELSQ